jgi:hypothetical protein
MRITGLARETRDGRIRAKALEALKNSDLTAVFETAGIDGDGYETAGAALRTVLAERLAQCTIRAMKEAKRRGMKLGAAAIILAAQQK